MNTILLGLAARPVMNGIAHSFFAVHRGRPLRLDVRPKESGTHSDEKAVKGFFICRPSPGFHSGRSSVIHRLFP